MSPLILLLVLLVLVGLPVAAGWRLAPRLLPRISGPEDAATLAMLLGLTLYHAVPLLLGWVTGSMTPVWPGIGAAMAIALIVVPDRYLIGLGPPQCQPPINRQFLLSVVPPLCLALVFGALAAHLPVRVYDAVTYHIVNPMTWFNTREFDLRAFGPVDVDPSEYQAGTFPNPKAITVWLALILRPDGRGTALAQWPFLLLLMVAMPALARRVGIRGWWIPVLPILVLAMPEVALQSLESYADLAMLAVLVTLAWAAWVWADNHARPLGPRADTGPPQRFEIAVQGLPIGLALAWVVATKPTGLVLAPLAWLMLFGFAPVFLTQRLRAIQVLIAAGLIALLAAQPLGGPWYWRALVLHGNPIFPIRVEAGPIHLPGWFDAGINSTMMRQHTGRTGLSALINTVLELPRPAALSSWTGGLGAPLALLSLPLVLLAGGIVFLRWRKVSIPIGRDFYRSGFTWLAAVALTLAIPTAGVARFLLFPAAMLFLLLPPLTRGLIPALRVVVVVFLVLAIGYDALRIGAAVLFQQRAPVVVAQAFGAGGGGAVREDRWPGDIGVLTILRDDILTSETAVLAARDLRPWLVQPAQPRGRWFRRLGPSPIGENPADFLVRVQETGANLLYVREGTAEWNLVGSILPVEMLLVDRRESSAEHRHGPRPEPRGQVWHVPTRPSDPRPEVRRP